MPRSNEACVPQLLSPHVATTEAHLPRVCEPQQEKSPQQEARVRQQSTPHLPQLEKARM